VPRKGQRDIFQLDSGGAIGFSSILVRRRLRGALAQDAADGLVERRQERRAVARAKDLGPPVTSPDERRSVIRLRTASVNADRLFGERLAGRRMTSARP